MATDARLVPIMRFCGQCSCGCPELLIAPDAPAERRVVMTDDFGQRIEMGADQFHELLERARSGALDEAMLTAG
ncbi:MAG TPA: hypothetical protein VII47_01610 [Actinomycetota bacterium]|jgi:hypothetical protein